MKERTRNSVIRSPILLVLLLPLVLTGLAQDGDAPPDTPQFRVESPIVQVPVVVVDKDGKLYGELTKENFQILEDGIPREITSFAGREAAQVVVFLLEDSDVVRYLLGEVLRPTGVFVTQIMERDDYAAIIAFDIKPHIFQDFTRNRQKLLNALNKLAQSPTGFNDSSLFDAVKFALNGGVLEEVEYKGISEVKGRTAVLLVATGMNTFSSITLGQVRREVWSAGVPIYSIGVGELAYLRAEPYLSGLQRIEYLQAQNNLQTLSRESGGVSYNVRFSGALDEVLESINAMLTYQYTLGYRPAQAPSDDGKREIEVLVDIDGDGQPDNDKLDLNYRRFYYEPAAAGQEGEDS